MLANIPDFSMLNYEGSLKRLATLLIFSGLDQDGACAVMLPQVCLATSAKVVVFHSMCVFVRALVRNLFCSGGTERYFMF
jgi:hypothetical protein